MVFPDAMFMLLLSRFVPRAQIKPDLNYASAIGLPSTRFLHIRAGTVSAALLALREVHTGFIPKDHFPARLKRAVNASQSGRENAGLGILSGSIRSGKSSAQQFGFVEDLLLRE